MMRSFDVRFILVFGLTPLGGPGGVKLLPLRRGGPGGVRIAIKLTDTLVMIPLPE